MKKLVWLTLAVLILPIFVAAQDNGGTGATIEERVALLEQKVATLENNVSGLSQRAATLENNVSGLNGRLSILEALNLGNVITTLGQRIGVLEALNLQSRITALEQGLNQLNNDFCNKVMSCEVTPPGPEEKAVVFRTNVPQDRQGYCDIFSRGDTWIAFDLDGDGNLEGYSNYGSQSSKCNDLLPVMTPNGCEVHKLKYDQGIGINLKKGCIKFSTKGAHVEDAVLDKTQTEPYASNNQEVYS